MNYAVLISETVTELSEVEKVQKLVAKQKRVQFLRLLKTGEARTQAEAGKIVGWKLRYSQSIWHRYRGGGLAGLLDSSERWYFGKLSSIQMGRLQNYLAEFGAADLGEVRLFIEQSFGVHYTIGGVSGLCGRLRIKLKTARPSNVKKDVEAVRRYRKTLAF